MSNAGQAVLSIVGAVIGFFIGGPTGAIYGAQLGLLAGTALFPTQLPALQGPRLGDGQQTVSNVGAVIPWIHGAQTVGGIIIWASPIREVARTNTAGGKGGPEQSQTTYSYFRSFAILLCEGEIGGVRRIWANGKLIYDRTIPPDIEFDDLTTVLSGREALNRSWTSKMTIYSGSEDQMPDPVIESFEGSGNVPAYRGYAYVVFDDVELKPEDGNRMPGSWKFEVYEQGVVSTYQDYFYSQEVLYPWRAENRADPRDIRNSHQIAISFPISEIVTQDPGDDDPIPGFLERSEAETAIDRYVLAGVAAAYGSSGERLKLDSTGGTTAIEKNQSSTLYVHYTKLEPTFFVQQDEVAPNCPNYPPPGTSWYLDQAGGTSSRLRMTSAQRDEDDPFLPGWTGRQEGCLAEGQPITYFVDGLEIRIARSPVAPPPPREVGTPIPDADAFVVDGVLMPDEDWEYDDSQHYHVLQSFAVGYAEPAVNQIKIPLGPARPIDHPDDNQTFWETAYAKAVAAGDMPDGLVYGVDYPVEQNFGYRLLNRVDVIDIEDIDLATIVSRICDRASERAGQFFYDTSDLEGRTVVGYQISRIMAARAAIETLRPVGFFDAVESGVQLRFAVRGKPSVATLTDLDLGAFFAGESPVSKVTTKKALELELPRQIRVHYQDPARNYDPGEQLSPARFDTKAETVTDVDLGVAIDADTAAKCAEIAYRDAWASRWTHNTQLDVSKAAIEAADCIIVPVDDSNERLRLLKVTEKLPNLRVVEMVRDDDGSYVSTAVGTSPGYLPGQLALYGPVNVAMLDLPALSSDQEAPTLYAGVFPQIIGGSFRGAVIQRSTDVGGTFGVAGAATVAATYGTVQAPAGDGPSEIFDEAGSLVVELHNGVLSSATESEVLDGANAAAVGAHGRWNILQFRTVEHISGRLYRLGGLLQGRLGTENYIGTGVFGDSFVMLENVTTVPIAVPEIGASIVYRATPINTAQTTTGDVTLVASNATLKPYSPVHVEGKRDDGDLLITWVRRDRLTDQTGVQSVVPMSETSEDYEVDILDANGIARRTISVSTTQATYTEEQQIADFGEAQSSVPVVIYQISAQVGRGTGAEATL